MNRQYGQVSEASRLAAREAFERMRAAEDAHLGRLAGLGARLGGVTLRAVRAHSGTMATDRATVSLEDLELLAARLGL